MTTSMTPFNRREAAMARAAKRGATVPALQTTGGGGRIDPISAGPHLLQLVDVVDVTYSPSEFQDPENPKARVMFICAADEVDEKGNPKLLPIWTSTSLYEGDRKFKPGGLLSLLRGITGKADLTAEEVLDRWGDEDGEFDLSVMVYPYSADGKPLPGWVFGCEIEHDIQVGRNGQEFARARIRKDPRDTTRRATKEEWKMMAHAGDNYVRPKWVADQEASSPPADAPADRVRPVDQLDAASAVAGDPPRAQHPPIAPAPPPIEDDALQQDAAEELDPPF